MHFLKVGSASANKQAARNCREWIKVRSGFLTTMPNVPHASLSPEAMRGLLGKCADEGMRPDALGNIIPYYKVCRRSRVDEAELEAELEEIKRNAQNKNNLILHKTPPDYFTSTAAYPDEIFRSGVCHLA